MNAIEEKVAGKAFAQSELDDILVQCKYDTALFCQLFFPERFHLEFSEGHKELFDVLDNTDEPLIAVTAPRGFGKSTILNMVYPMKEILYRDRNLITQIANTADQAERDSTDLRNELTSNEYILATFGNYKSTSRDDPYSKRTWKTGNKRNKFGLIEHKGTMVVPRGVGQQIRGMKHGRFRFDLILGDDLEGTENVMSDEQRAKLWRWLHSDVLNSVQRARRLAKGEFPWRVVIVGTLLHEDSLLANLQENKNWTSIRLALADISDDGRDIKSTWQDFATDEDIRKLYAQFEEADSLDEFNREYLGVPVSARTQKFKKSMFKYFDESDIMNRSGLESVIIVDPARTTEAKSNDTAIIGWSLDAISGRLYVRDLIVAKLHPDDMYRETGEMAKRIGAHTVGIESTGLGEFITQPFKDFLGKWGYNLEYVDLKSKGMKNEKDNRIASLLPYYRQGRIYHNKSCCKPLEIQLLSFPFSKRKDAMDAGAYIIEMLHLGNRQFAPVDLSEFEGTVDEKIAMMQVKYIDKFAELERTYEPPIVGYEEPELTALGPQIARSQYSPRQHTWAT